MVGINLQVSVALGRPAIVLQSWPKEQQLANVMNGEDGINQTMQYLEAMPALFSQVSYKALHTRLNLEGTQQNQQG